jgi:CRISPR-associated protein Csy1
MTTKAIDPLAEARAAFQRGDHAQALRLAEALLTRADAPTEARVLAANAAIAGKFHPEAIAHLTPLLAAHPHNPVLRRSLSMAHNNLGARLRREAIGADARQRARAAFDTALLIWPDNPQAQYNHARERLDAGDRGALLTLRELQARQAEDDELLLDLIEAESRFDPPAADARLDALARDDTRLARLPAPAFASLAIANDRGDLAARVLTSVEGTAQATALFDLAQRASEACDIDAARAIFRHAAFRCAQPGRAFDLRHWIAHRLTLAPVHDDLAALRDARASFDENLRLLDAELDKRLLARLDPDPTSLAWCNFLLAYQGQNDLAAQTRYAELSQRAMRTFRPRWATAPVPPARARPRVGLLSPGFRHCTVGAYFGPWVGALRAAGIEVLAFAMGPGLDDTTAAIGREADALIRLESGVVDAIEQLRDAELDLLILPDIGMDVRVQVIAATRCAPRQWAAWGHPVTTGAATIDAYLSCAAMEPADAATHYREPVLTLPGIGTRYARPGVIAPRAREDLGLPGGRHLYLVPQSAFKIHPDNDVVYTELLRRDRDATLVFFLDPRRGADARLARRLRHAALSASVDPERALRFLPYATREGFLQVCAACDVMLDTLHWSGGNTALDALHARLPIATLPGRFMRGRQSTAMLEMMGLRDLTVASDVATLVMTAIDLATGARATARRGIDAGLGQVFGRDEPLTALVEHVRAAFSQAPA